MEKYTIKVSYAVYETHEREVEVVAENETVAIEAACSQVENEVPEVEYSDGTVVSREPVSLRSEVSSVPDGQLTLAISK